MHRMKIEFSADNKRLGKALYKLGRSSVRPEFRIEYTVAEPEKCKNELLANAVTDAKAKAVMAMKINHNCFFNAKKNFFDSVRKF